MPPILESYFCARGLNSEEGMKEEGGLIQNKNCVKKGVGEIEEVRVHKEEVCGVAQKERERVGVP